MQEVPYFLKSHQVATTEIGHFINILVHLNYDIEITLMRRYNLCDVLNNSENNDSVFHGGDALCRQAKACAKEKKTVGTNTDIITVSNVSEFDTENITKLYDVYEDSILKMKYLEGDDPSQFWLRFDYGNKLLSHLAEIKRKLQLGELHRISTTPVVGQFIIGQLNCVFRGCIISVVSGQVIAVDMDTSALKLLNTHDIWEIGDCFSCFPPQAILCKIWNIERVEGWTTYLSTLFKNCLDKCNLVVTVKGIIPGVVPTFIIDLEAHDDVSRFDVNISEWINSCVKPAIEQMKMFGLVGAREETVFQDLHHYANYSNDGYDSDVSTPVQNVADLQNMEMNSDVGELGSSVHTTHQNGIESSCVNEKLDETPIRDSNELILNRACANNETTSLDCVSDNFVAEESEEVNQVNGRNFAEQIVKHSFPEQCGELEHEVLSKSCGQILKSYVVKCLLKKDKSLEMTFLRGTDPWSFFLSYVPLQEIDKLKKKMAERAESGQLIPLQNVPEIDDFAIGKCDNEYCRVRVIHISLRNKMGDIVIADIDSGETKFVSMSALWVLEEEFYSPPARAINCSLWNIPRKVFNWCFDIQNLFTNVMSRGPCRVNIKDVTYISGKWIHHVQIQIFTDCVFDVSEWIMNFIFPSLKNINQCYMSDIDVDNVISMLDPSTVFRKEQTVPDVGEQLTVVITEVVNMGLFYAVPAKIQCEGKFQSCREALMNINKKIYSAVQGGHLKMLQLLYEGTIVLARYNRDKNWYRARVLASSFESWYVEVFFVDYGNVDKVHKFYVREISKDLCELPFQAIKLFIDSIDLTILKDKNAQEIAETLLTTLKDKCEVVINVTRVVNKDIKVQVIYEGRDIGEEIINLYHTS